MNNQHFETQYSAIVEPKYGPHRDITKYTILTHNIGTPHSYSIPKYKRVDMTQYHSYSIDPV